jgi:hypothetical protein
LKGFVAFTPIDAAAFRWARRVLAAGLEKRDDSRRESETYQQAISVDYSPHAGTASAGFVRVGTIVICGEAKDCHSGLFLVLQQKLQSAKLVDRLHSGCRKLTTLCSSLSDENQKVPRGDRDVESIHGNSDQIAVSEVIP